MRRPCFIQGYTRGLPEVLLYCTTYDIRQTLLGALLNRDLVRARLGARLGALPIARVPG